jgi:hypothetical protein
MKIDGAVIKRAKIYDPSGKAISRGVLKVKIYEDIII